MREFSCAYTETPIGLLEVRGDDKGVKSVQFVEEKRYEGDIHATVLEMLGQIDAYFAGDLQAFHSLPLTIASTEFQEQVWDGARAIPYGETRTYGQLAKEIGHKKASRAVGNALNKNPLLLVVPCHRILPSSGKVGGFGCGSWRKEWLLKHEKSLQEQGKES